MEPHKLERLEEIISNGYEFNTFDYLSKGYDIFRQNMGGFVGFILVMGAVNFIADLIPILGDLAFTLVLCPVLSVGPYIVAHKIYKRETHEFADFFKGTDYLKELVIFTAVTMAVSLFFGLPFAGVYYDLYFGEPMNILQESFSPFSFLIFIPLIYLIVSWSWSSLFIVFYKMNFWDAMEMSRKIIMKNWLQYFFFLIVLGFTTVSGAILLLVGMLFTIPIVFCAQYVAFAEITELLNDDEDDLERHLIV
ncbi:MAG: hypothetical protein AB8G15_05160 [Saprospiraceae bacterium]